MGPQQRALGSISRSVIRTHTHGCNAIQNPDPGIGHFFGLSCEHEADLPANNSGHIPEGGLGRPSPHRVREWRLWVRSCCPRAKLPVPIELMDSSNELHISTRILASAFCV